MGQASSFERRIAFRDSRPGSGVTSRTSGGSREASNCGRSGPWIWKRGDQNCEIIGNLEQLRALELPIAVGPSRKSFLRKEREDETEFATAAAVTACILKGAHLVRVHNVKAMRTVVELADAIRQAAAERQTEQPATQVRWQRGQ